MSPTRWNNLSDNFMPKSLNYVLNVSPTLARHTNAFFCLGIKMFLTTVSLSNK